MSDDSIRSTQSTYTNSAVTAAQNAETDSQPAKSKSTEGVTQQDFLKLLVNQLQNQDPLNPMNSDEFAVQLAQFTQVEQLIAINDKLENGLGGSGASGAASMAGFLGTQVVLANQQAHIDRGEGPNIMVDMPAGAASARIDFIDSDGKVAGSYAVEDLEPGRRTIELNGVDVPNGSYDVRAIAVSSSGGFVELDAKVTGTVEGFVLDPEPALIVGGEEVALADVTEVYKS